MAQLIRSFTQYNNIWLPAFLVIIAGILSGFIAAAGILVLTLLATPANTKPFVLLIIALGTYYLSDNIGSIFGFADTFRFVVLGVSLLYLMQYHIFNVNPGNYLLPFSLIATAFSLLFSPLGMDAILRSIGFWLVAITIFRITDVLFSQSPHDAMKILVLWLVLFLGLNLLSGFISIVPGSYLGSRFRGLMGNPNGLGLLVIVSYPFLDLIKSRGETNFSNRFFLLAKILLISVAILTGSRNAILSLMIYEVVARLREDRAWLFVVFVFIGATAYNLFSIDLFRILESMGLSEFFRVETLTDLSGRTEVWNVVWEEIKKSPWTGKGILYDIHFINDYAATHIEGVPERHWSAVWSSYLSLLLDTGIIGVLAFAWFFKKMYQLAQNKQLAFAFITIVLFSAITESWLAASMNAFFPMFILYLAIQSQPIYNYTEE